MIEKQEFKRNTIIMETPVYRLHKFNAGKGIPLFIIPPHAGRHGCITQRLIDKCVETDRPVFAYELLPATLETASTSVYDLITAIESCQSYIGDIVDLVAVCQGGWVGMLYAAMHPAAINKLAAFAAPFNTNTGEDNCIEKYMKTPYIVEYHKMIIAMLGGIQPGYMQWAAFAMVKPEYVFTGRWVDLNKLIWDKDEKGLKKWKKNNAWYDTPQDIAGTWFIEALQHHFRDNELFENKWVINGSAVNLGNITCPVTLYAGDIDEITHWKQMFDIEHKVNGFVKKILFKNAGHTKVFVGTDELGTFKKTFLG